MTTSPFDPSTFEPLVGAGWRIIGDSTLDATLLQVDRLGETQFSLVFRGPSTPVFPQRIYRVEHDELEGVELFLVPIGPDGGKDGMRYEAVFG